jgi:two-component system LytT family sensor kinase
MTPASAIASESGGRADTGAHPGVVSRTRWGLLLGIWAIPGVLSSAQSYLGYALRGEMPRNWPYVLIGFLTWLSWAILTPLIVSLTHRVPLQRGGERFARSLGVHVGAAILLTFVQGAFWLGVSFWVGSVMEPGSYGQLPIARTLAITLFGRMVSGLVTYGAVVGVATAADAQRRLREREVRSAQLEGELTSAQLRALKMQLHPHFLFNTLHAITVLIGEDAAAARRMVMQLGDLLRLTLSRAASTETSLAAELELVRLYLEIERTRFHDRLSVQYDVDPDAMNARVPDLILQPLVENAVRHGISPRAGAGEIVVRAKRDDGQLVLEVRDNGAGFPVHGASRQGIGLTTTRSRLTHLYGAEHALELGTAAGGGCVVRIRMPYRTEEA